MSLLVKYFRLTSQQRNLLWTVCRVSAGVRFRVITNRYPAVFSSLGVEQKETSDETNPQHIQAVTEVKDAIRQFSRVSPWRFRCLEQSVTAKIILNRKAIQSTLYMGVCKTDNTKMKAHSWVRSGNIIVCGGAGKERYTVVTYYS